MEKHVIIVAGGKGTRMNTEVPKQFMELAGKPLLMHTTEIFFRACNAPASLVIVIPRQHKALWEKLCHKHHFQVPHKVVDGGRERFFSVRNALSVIGKNGLIAIHDGVRPAVSPDVIKRCFEAAEIYGNAVPAVAVAESMRRIFSGKTKVVNRKEYLLVQTPQTFRADLLHKAYQAPYREQFTDDASVLEHSGVAVHLVEGNKENIKVTTPGDLLFAEWLLSKSRPVE
ncbi:MAG: 2-C-methyl-D-erythritol 4-phosphate cytidylyltransferase [Bacteroidales bacterium]|nr:2-C-methyl-D-erythritol 4-phosphate cytidylyltransferase [Bacteroidales bacterium]